MSGWWSSQVPFTASSIEALTRPRGLRCRACRSLMAWQLLAACAALSGSISPRYWIRVRSPRGSDRNHPKPFQFAGAPCRLRARTSRCGVSPSVASDTQPGEPNGGAERRRAAGRGRLSRCLVDASPASARGPPLGSPRLDDCLGAVVTGVPRGFHQRSTPGPLKETQSLLT